MSWSSYKDCIKIFVALTTIGFFVAYVIMHTTSEVHDEDIVSITDISNNSPNDLTTQTTHKSTEKSDISYQNNEETSTKLDGDDKPNGQPSLNDADMKLLDNLHNATTPVTMTTGMASMITSQPENKNKKKLQNLATPVDNKKLMAHIKTQCAKNGLNTDFNPIERKAWPRLLIGSSKYKILYSSNPKSGSTSFKKFLIRLNGNTEPYDDMKNVHAPKKHEKLNSLQLTTERDIIHEKKLDPLKDSDQIISLATEKLLNEYFVVGFIRNPFTRIISGFRDKVLRKKQKAMTGSIVEDMRGDDEESDVKKFQSFVKLIVLGKIKNFHFKAQYEAMKICTFPYDLLGQIETNNEQIKGMQKVTGTESFEFPGSRVENGKDEESTSDLVHRYFDKMPADILDLFYRLYRLDFELTGYTTINDQNFPYIVLPVSKDVTIPTISPVHER